MKRFKSKSFFIGSILLWFCLCVFFLLRKQVDISHHSKGNTQEVVKRQIQRSPVNNRKNITFQEADSDLNLQLPGISDGDFQVKSDLAVEEPEWFHIVEALSAEEESLKNEIETITVKYKAKRVEMMEVSNAGLKRQQEIGDDINRLIAWKFEIVTNDLGTGEEIDELLNEAEMELNIEEQETEAAVHKIADYRKTLEAERDRLTTQLNEISELISEFALE